MQLHVQPGASQSKLVGLYGARLKISLRAPAVDGKANQALVEFLAEFFEIPLAQVKIIRGESSRQKAVMIYCGDPQILLRRLMAQPALKG